MSREILALGERARGGEALATLRDAFSKLGLRSSWFLYRDSDEQLNWRAPFWTDPALATLRRGAAFRLYPCRLHQGALGILLHITVRIVRSIPKHRYQEINQMMLAMPLCRGVGVERVHEAFIREVESTKV